MKFILNKFLCKLIKASLTANAAHMLRLLYNNKKYVYLFFPEKPKIAADC